MIMHEKQHGQDMLLFLFPKMGLIGKVTRESIKYLPPNNTCLSGGFYRAFF